MGGNKLSGYELPCIRNQFIGCFKAIGVFERIDADNRYFESEVITRENKKWLVVAAGVNRSEAANLFKGIPKRAEKAVIPLQYRDACELRILFELRACEDPAKASGRIAPFAARSDVPWVEIRHAYLRAANLPKNQHRIDNLRWEWDVRSSVEQPTERWLRDWYADCGFNPAHPLPHLHINSRYVEFDQDSTRRPVETRDELRLATGNTNPLAFLLSLGNWLKKLR